MESKRTSIGGSLLVPSVQELAKEPLIKVPSRYVRYHEDLPATSCLSSSMCEVPVIDMQHLLSGDSTTHELEKLHLACKDWGFFQMLTNGIYKSIEHKATVNLEKERLSIGTFLGPKLEGDLGPAPSLITSDTPPRFTRVSGTDFYKKLFSTELKSKSNLEQYLL